MNIHIPFYGNRPHVQVEPSSIRLNGCKVYVHSVRDVICQKRLYTFITVRSLQTLDKD